MFLLKSRREREKIIVQSMIRIYCAENHLVEGKLCEECLELTIYAEKRLISCLYGEVKPVCKECPVHCYSPQRREQMRLVMQYSGPRMLFRRPVFALVHMIDNLIIPISKPLKSHGKK
jgi:hypothetical protein